jgi:hypothetical protein
MYQIEMANGKKHAVSMCGAADGCLHVNIEDGTSFTGVVREFRNSENTSVIKFLYGEMETIHEGYTVLISIFWDGDGRYNIMLKKPA